MLLLATGSNGMNGRLGLLPVAVENDRNIGFVHIPLDKTVSQNCTGSNVHTASCNIQQCPR